MIAPEHRHRLTRQASDSITHGARRGTPLAVDLEAWPAELREVAASFVTLQIRGRLRGCIGSLNATRPLVTDVSLNAAAAAFRDPRFDAVVAEEVPLLDIHIAVLSAPVPLEFGSESELLTRIRPGEDGLVLKAGSHRATFLPAVWEKIADPLQFLTQLKLKAGLAADFWSDDLAVERYTTESW